VRLVHRPADGSGERTLAGGVELADSIVSRARGLMFRRELPDDSALAFRFERPARRSLHMVFVPFAIDAVWVVGDEVTHVARLSAWIGLGTGTADLVVELPAGAADGVERGDALELVGSTESA
jgi:hypothetical protein